jgi:hypothetical protein
MRGLFFAGFAGAALLASASPGLALEKWNARAGDTSSPPWNSSATCVILYYNQCTGWSWVWGPWAGFERFGVCVDACCPNAELATTALHMFSGVCIAGWGSTGTASIYAADANGCPSGAPLASQWWIPGAASPHEHVDVHSWTTPVPDRFTVVYEFGPAGSAEGGGSSWCYTHHWGARVVTDHPAAGPTGPAACGLCYPATRVSHSFRWGTPLAPLCPGSPFFDGTCDAELFVDLSLACPTGLEPEGWGRIKALYR